MKMGFVKAAIRYCLPYALAFSLGAVAGSGVLSKQKPDYFQRTIVSDREGKQYVVDIKNKTLEVLTENYQKKEESKLADLLK